LQDRDSIRPNKKRSLISLSYVFASFFGALMIGSAYAYFNYKFTQYKFIDFNKVSLWSKSDIFVPVDKEYIVVVFNSNNQIILQKIKKINKKYKVLAIDLNQKRFQSNDKVIFVTSSMSNLLQIVQRFNIYSVPSFFFLKRHNRVLYKQDSAIEVLDNF
jgi:hypothetical protein